MDNTQPPISTASSSEEESRDVIELRIYLDGILRKIVAGTGLLIALMAIGAYLYQEFIR
jgi:hypothetical protein